MAIKIDVDTGLCADHGQCVFSAPEVFELDMDGRLVVLSAEVDESLRASVLDAADVCPVQAISIREA
jgi:ferredoxin